MTSRAISRANSAMREPSARKDRPMAFAVVLTARMALLVAALDQHAQTHPEPVQEVHDGPNEGPDRQDDSPQRIPDRANRAAQQHDQPGR